MTKGVNWKFGDVIRRHISSEKVDEQPVAMIICRDDDGWYPIAILRQGLPSEYVLGKSFHADPENWTLVDE